MSRRILLLAVVVMTGAFASSLRAAGHLNDSVVVLPQVARGDRIETVVVFLNTSSTAADVAVTATDERLLEPTFLELDPFERKELRLDQGGELVKGAIRVESENTVSVEGRIRTLPEVGIEGSFVSQVLVLAQPLHTSVVIPIAYRTDGIDNTGVAVYIDTGGVFDYQFYDAAGNLVGEGSSVEHQRQFALYVDEIQGAGGFLGDQFKGSLRISFTGAGLAATALYTRGTELWTAQIQPVKEAKALFRVTMGPGVSPEVLHQLAFQYGFSVSELLSDTQGIVSATDEVARALERDYRVEKVVGELLSIIGG